jgi:hypothetical protein
MPTPKKKRSPSTKAKKKRKNFRLPLGLTLWAERYAKRKNTNLTQLIVNHLTELREGEKSQ